MNEKDSKPFRIKTDIYTPKEYFLLFIWLLYRCCRVIILQTYCRNVISSNTWQHRSSCLILELSSYTISARMSYSSIPGEISLFQDIHSPQISSIVWLILQYLCLDSWTPPYQPMTVGFNKHKTWISRKKVIKIIVSDILQQFLSSHCEKMLHEYQTISNICNKIWWNDTTMCKW